MAEDLDGPAAYSLYDVLRTLIERVGWPTEQEKRLALGSVDRAEKAQIFGNLATMMTCDHPDSERTAGGRCADCGKQVENTVYQGTRHENRFVRNWGSI